MRKVRKDSRVSGGIETNNSAHCFIARWVLQFESMNPACLWRRLAGLSRDSVHVDIYFGEAELCGRGRLTDILEHVGWQDCVLKVFCFISLIQAHSASLHIRTTHTLIISSRTIRF